MKKMHKLAARLSGALCVVAMLGMRACSSPKDDPTEAYGSYQISGTVTNPENQPVAGAEMTLTKFGGLPVATTQTGENGYYEFKVVNGEPLLTATVTCNPGEESGLNSASKNLTIKYNSPESTDPYHLGGAVLDTINFKLAAK